MDHQIFLFAMCVGMVMFYAYTQWVLENTAHFLAIITIVLSFGILQFAPSGNIFTVAGVAFVVSVILWRTSMIAFYALPGTFQLAKRNASDFQVKWPELLGWTEPLVQSGLAIYIIATWPQEIIADGNIYGPAGASIALFYPRIMRIALRDSENRARAGHLIQQEHQLVQTGIYGYVRHPMYMAALLLWLAAAVALNSLWILILAAVYAFPVFLFYIRAEEVQLSNTFGDQYEEYKGNVPGFAPRQPFELMKWILFSRG